jgi:uncharacterized membrane protein (DUF106 family)
MYSFVLQASTVATPITATPMPLFIVVAVVVIGICYSMLSIFVQRRFGNPKRQREIQAKMRDLSKQMQEKAKKNEDVSEQQKQLMPLLNENMKLQLKSTLFILPLFFIIYYGALPIVFHPYSNTEINFIVPLTYTGLFFVAVVVSGLIGSSVVLLRDRKLSKAMMQQNTVQVQDEKPQQ